MRRAYSELSHKYAYNINDSSKVKVFSLGSGKDFLRLNHGFYDEIASNDISIKQKEKQLQKIKNDSLKEFVFTNKQIPDKWKKKLGYQTNVIKLLARDNTLLYYIARGGGQNKSQIDTTSTKWSTFENFNKFSKTGMPMKTGKVYSGLKTCYSQIFPQIQTRFNPEAKKDDDEMKSEQIVTQKQEEPYKKIFEEEDLTNNENNSINAKLTGSPMKIKLSKKDFMTEKDIANLLDEFRIAYPIQLKKEEPENFFDDNKKEKTKENMDNVNKKKTKVFNAGSFLQTSGKKYNPFVNVHQLKSKRQRVFRQNIFNNLVPSKKPEMLDSKTNVNIDERLKKIKHKKKEEKYSPYLNFDYESFYKRVKINDPAIEKQLENINFYGPYYSYCPPCLNRNLEYYNNLEPNHCVRLIKYIRKIRGKKIIDIKEKDKSSSALPSKEIGKEKNINSEKEDFKMNEIITEKGESEISYNKTNNNI